MYAILGVARVSTVEYTVMVARAALRLRIITLLMTMLTEPDAAATKEHGNRCAAEAALEVHKLGAVNMARFAI